MAEALLHLQAAVAVVSARILRSATVVRQRLELRESEALLILGVLIFSDLPPLQTATETPSTPISASRSTGSLAVGVAAAIRLSQHTQAGPVVAGAAALYQMAASLGVAASAAAAAGLVLAPYMQQQVRRAASAAAAAGPLLAAQPDSMAATASSSWSGKP
jgi:hypothetical protein